MKLKSNYFALLVLVFIFSCGVTQPKVIISQSKIEKIQLALDSIYTANPNSVGLMIHVEAPDQHISWNAAIGVSDIVTKRPLQKDQPVLIASNVKMYVSVAILRLIEQGKFTLFQPIGNLITTKTKNILLAEGYDLKTITVAHLLSHTSGIMDYVNQDYMDFVNDNQSHRWTRDEQIALSATVGEPLGQAGDTFSYADVNYLILTEILENSTHQDFYTAIRELINYQKHELNSTWFISLDDKPSSLKPLAHQYWGEYNWNSYSIDPSFDLYGGGGIASTTEDLARFSQLLFEGKIIENQEILELIYTKIKTKDEQFANYYLGLTQGEINGLTMYGHGGFWGTAVNYFPSLNASISVFVLERDQRILRKTIVEKIVEILNTDG